jgi:heme/copper-type cytochrome/quinol oxidase subunit 1
MRRKIIFYIAWDVVFYVFIYAMSSIENVVFNGYYKMEHPHLVFFIPVIMRTLVGGLICWLALITLKYKATVKSAVAEFVIVGGLAFYFTTFVIFYFLVPITPGSYLSFLRPQWMLFDRNLTAITIGSVLFGYELLVFLVRLVSCRKKAKQSDSEPENAQSM